MAKEFFKKLALGVAIALVSTATVAGVSALTKAIRGEDEANSSDDAVKYCTHTGLIEIPGVAPTCTDPGATEGGMCASCGGIIKRQDYLEPLGHTKIPVAAIAATCKLTGLTEGLKCSTCGVVFVEQEVIPATGCVDEDVNGICDLCEDTLPEGMTLLRKIAKADNEVETAITENTSYSVGTVIRIYHGSPGVASNWINLSFEDENYLFVRSYNNEVWVEDGFIEPLFTSTGVQRFDGELYAYATEEYVDYYIGAGSCYNSQGVLVGEIVDAFTLYGASGPGAEKTCIITLPDEA